ncbi:dehydrogenase [Lithospermum erythrorhizon]|uniref:Dehydrogenase n=1 Tax=Lithospermum erythrorhizon TaxID=34254 RepID=A0AAV3PPD5_LITER
MEKLVVMRSICRSICRRSLTSTTAAASNLRRLHYSPSSDFRRPLAMGSVSKRFLSGDVNRMPALNDPGIERALKDLIAASWDELPDAVVHDANKALSRDTSDKAAQVALANALRAAEAVEEFTGRLISLKMEIDDSIGLSGEDVKPLPEECVNAYRVFLQRYFAYLQAFGPEEGYLRKKVENEIGTRLIYLKMRCSGLGSEWGKVSVLGTSGIAGSYVEQRF